MRLLLLIILPIQLLFDHGVPAFANVRAPSHENRHHSSSMKNEEIGITLTREELSVRLPAHNLNERPHRLAEVQVAYRFTSKKAGTIPILFVGILIEDISISLNGETTESGFVENTEELKAYAAKYSQHCKDSGRCLIDHFEPGQIQVMESDERIRQQIGLVRFTAAVKKGDNSLLIKYNQGVNLWEGNTGYLKSFYWDTARFTFDYALYPSHSLARSPNFILDVNVVVPDGIKKRLMFKSHVAPVVTSNLNLTKIHTEEKYTQVFHGMFRTFPADFLTLAFRYK